LRFLEDFAKGFRPARAFSGQASRFDFPDQFHYRPGTSGSIGPKNGRQTVATREHCGVWTMGCGVAQPLFEFFTFGDQTWRIDR
jgi:hypothetical protein